MFGLFGKRQPAQETESSIPPLPPRSIATGRRKKPMGIVLRDTFRGDTFQTCSSLPIWHQKQIDKLQAQQKEALKAAFPGNPELWRD